MTREQWLGDLVTALAVFSEDINIDCRQEVWKGAHVSCGYGTNKVRTRTFDVVPGEQTADREAQIFISPLIHTTQDAVDAVFGALAALISGSTRQNGKDFKNAVKTLESLREFAFAEVAEWKEKEYPQPAITVPHKERGAGGEGQALLKIECRCRVPEEKPYVLRATPKQAERGLPECPFCHRTVFLVDSKQKEADSE